jgi:hypothetical protein
VTGFRSRLPQGCQSGIGNGYTVVSNCVRHAYSLKRVAFPPCLAERIVITSPTLLLGRRPNPPNIATAIVAKSQRGDRASGGVQTTIFAEQLPLSASRVFVFCRGGLVAEGGRIELHRASTRLTAYKAGSTPNGLRLPYIKTPTRLQGVGETGDPAGSRTQLPRFASRVAGRSPTGSLVQHRISTHFPRVPQEPNAQTLFSLGD